MTVWKWLRNINPSDRQHNITSPHKNVFDSIFKRLQSRQLTTCMLTNPRVLLMTATLESNTGYWAGAISRLHLAGHLKHHFIFQGKSHGDIHVHRITGITQKFKIDYQPNLQKYGQRWKHYNNGAVRLNSQCDDRTRSERLARQAGWPSLFSSKRRQQ